MYLDNPAVYSPYMKKLMEQEKSGFNDLTETSGDCTGQQEDREITGACGDCKQLNDEQSSNKKSTEKSQKSKSDRIGTCIFSFSSFLLLCLVVFDLHH